MYWGKTSGSTASNARFVSASGSFAVNSNIGSFSVSLSTDTLLHANETFQVQLYTDSGNTIPIGIASTTITILGKQGVTTISTYTVSSVQLVDNSNTGYHLFGPGNNSGVITGITINESLISMGTADDGTQWQNGVTYISGNYSTLDTTPTSGLFTIGTSVATSVQSAGNDGTLTLNVPGNYLLTGIYNNGYLYGSGNQASTLSSYLMVSPIMDNGNIVDDSRIVHSGSTTVTLSTSWNTSQTTNIIPSDAVIRQITFRPKSGAHNFNFTATVTYETIRIRQ